MHYLDNAATTRPSKGTVEAIENSLTSCFGNPSSLHRLGFEAEQQVESARSKVGGSSGL